MTSDPTAGYLLPVLQALHQMRIEGATHLPSPHCLVLVPTPDLAVQVCTLSGYNCSCT